MKNHSAKTFGATCLTTLALALLCGSSAEAAQSLLLAWNPSTSGGIAGYHIYYGSHGTNFQYKLDAGTNTTFEVPGLQEGQTNTFAVSSYNANGVDSPLSNLIDYIVPGLVTIAPAPGVGDAAVLITFPVAAGHTYQVQTSVDLVTWDPLWRTTATNNVWMKYKEPMSANPKMCFYRLVWQ